MRKSELERTFPLVQAMQDLERDGVAVVPNVMTTQDCDRQVALLREWLDRFPEGQFPKNVSSIIHEYGIGQCETAWECRLKVKPIFAQIYGTDKLLTSFDGLAISQPPENGKTKFAKDPGYDGLHHDQGPRRVGLHAIQGALYLEDATAEDWCLKVITKSHKHHSDFFAEYPPNPNSEHRKLNLKKNTNEVQWYLDRGGQVKRIACLKGGMILWDSRTVHSGAPPLEGREHSDRWRFCVFVCMAPAKWATEKDYAAKAHGLLNMRTSRHWPANGFSLFQEFEKHAEDVPGLPAQAQSEEAQYLSGALRYDFDDKDLPDWTPQLTDYPDYELPY